MLAHVQLPMTPWSFPAEASSAQQQADADEMVANLLRWIQGVYQQRNRKGLQSRFWVVYRRSGKVECCNFVEFIRIGEINRKKSR